MTKHKIKNKSKAQISNNKTLVLIFVILILNLFCALNFDICHLAFAQDKIVAIVNSDIITQKDLNDFINFMRLQLFAEYKGEQLESKIQSMKLDLLDRLLEDRLILQQAKKNNLKIDENVVKGRLAEIKKRYPSDTEFQQALSRQGLTQSDIEAKIRDQLLMYNIIDLKVKSKIMVSPSEVTDFYQENPEQFKIPQECQVTSIAIDKSDLAKDIFNNLKKGEDLNNLSERYNLTIDKVTVRQDGELRKDIEEAIFKLNINEVSAPLNINNTFYIFRLDNIIAPRQETLLEAQDKVYGFLYETKLQEGLSRWLDELKQESYIKILQD